MTTATTTTTTPTIYKYFADIVYDSTGIVFSEKDYYRLDSRFITLITHYQLKDVSELYNLYLSKTSPEMKKKLIDLCTNNETYFFRDTKPFNTLVKDIIPEILEKNVNSKINIWSCASSTGQEALSILMTIREKCPKLPTTQVSLESTDVSEEALTKAKAGNYSNLDVQRGLAITLLVKYFNSIDEDDSWTAKPNLISGVSYEKLNLHSDIYPIGKYDIIFCRNVLIYQSQENKNLILEKMYNALKPGGYFIMGAGESLIGSTCKLVPVRHFESLLFKREA